MMRLTTLLCLFSLTVAIVLIVQPDPWARADEKATQDAQRLADLTASPDRVGWRLNEDVSLQRAVLWDADGAQRYPPPDGMVPLPHEFSDDTLRELTLLQSETETALWRPFDMAGHHVLHCRARPAVCLVYNRTILEETLALRPGALASGPANRLLAPLFLAMACLFGGGALWLRRQSTVLTPDFRVVPEHLVAIRDTLEVSLTPRDVKLLSILQDRSGAVVTKDELYDAGWGRDYMPNSRALDQHIINLRRKLDPDKSRPVLIETVHGVGYRLVI